MSGRCKQRTPLNTKRTHMATTKEDVLRQLDALNAELHTLLSTLEQYDEAQLNATPAAGSWSALQTMHHVMLAEKYALQYCQKKLSFDPDLSKAGLSTRLRSFLVSHYDRIPIKAKAPKAVSSTALPAQSTLASVRTTWQAQRAQLAEFLAQQPLSRFQEEVFKHPFAGRLDFRGMLNFFQGHFRRHRQQALRALRVAS
jgi:uncharacterized damage-inducible protein DinB